MKDRSWKALISTTPASLCDLSNEIECLYLFKLVNITEHLGCACTSL
jgi:hypothetical protein